MAKCASLTCVCGQEGPPFKCSTSIDQLVNPDPDAPMRCRLELKQLLNRKLGLVLLLPVLRSPRYGSIRMLSLYTGRLSTGVVA